MALLRLSQDGLVIDADRRFSHITFFELGLCLAPRRVAKPDALCRILYEGFESRCQGCGITRLDQYAGNLMLDDFAASRPICRN